MSSEIEGMDENNPTSSGANTSKKAKRANRTLSRAHTDDDDETNDGDNKQSKRMKISNDNGNSSKRGHSGEVKTTETSQKKRKKQATEDTGEKSEVEPELPDAQCTKKKSYSIDTSRKKLNGKRIDDKVKPGTSAGSRRIPHGPQSSQSSLGSQSIFSQAQLTSHPGIIKSLHLTNFMCHSNFTHNFHSNLNFITGQNGSGKSALLSGILIALGGKATVTSRTTSLKALVQKGKNTCRVAVTLLNINGLRRYGEEISIERWVSVNGATGYRIKSTDGEECESFNWRPMKKPELDRILLGLNIQIDNPVAVLNQEVARSFLRSKDPKVKFNLFYDGTLLSKLETILKETKEELHETRALLTNQKLVIDAVKNELFELNRKYQKMTELDTIRDKLSDVHNEYLWSVVIEHEKSVNVTSTSLTQITKEIEALVKKLEELKKDHSTANEESILQEQADTRSELAEKQQEVTVNRSQLAEVKRRHLQLKAKLTHLVSSVVSKEAQYDKLKKSLEKIEAERAAKAKDITNQEAEVLKDLQERKKQLEAVFTSLKSDSDNFRQAAEEKQDVLRQLDAEGRNLRSQMEGKKRQISSLNSRNANKYIAFGSKMEQLVNKIHAHRHKFRRPPKGPLGACFRVKDQRYAAIIESILLNVLDSFVVGDPADLTYLKQLIGTVYNDQTGSQRRTQGGRMKTPGIHCMRYAEKMYDISRNHATHPDAPSILELIEIEDNDHVIMNALIDIMDVEKQIVFKDNSSASRVLKNEETVPRRLKHAYTLQWYKFFPAPHYAARVMRIRNRTEFLRSGRNKELEIESFQSEIKSLENEVKSLDGKKAAIKADELSLKSRHEEKTNEITKIRRQIGEVMNEIKRQTTKIRDNEKRLDLNSCYEELQDLQDEITKQSTERDSATKELEPLNPKLNELENRKRALDNDTQKLNAKMSSFDERREKLNTKRMQIESMTKKAREVMGNKETSKTQLTGELDSKKAELQERLNEATSSCPKRVVTKRSPSAVKIEFEGIKVRIKETEARLGNKEELRARIEERKEKYAALKSEYLPLVKMLKIVEHTHEKQDESFENMKHHMGRTLVLFFTSMAKQRGYEGRLLVDFETKELYYFVCPDGDSASKALKTIDAQEKQAQHKSADQLKQNKVVRKALVEYSLGLSGGERSFATICFIMALWQVMECPFYMLDEFDVFMDAFNRKTSQIALMTHAKRFSQNQFVLFTPLDIGELPGPDDACVLRLCPPKRNVNGGGPENTGSSNQESEATSQDKTDGSPNHSTENIDPMGENSAVKGKAKSKKQRRGGAAIIREI